jgi:hypothetical protein
MIKQVRKYFIQIVLFVTLGIGCHKSDLSVKSEDQSIDLQKHSNKPAGLINIRDMPVEAVFFNQCCNEDVQIYGTAHIVVNENIIHLVVSDMTGIGATTNYNYAGRGPSVETNVFYSNQFEGTLTFILNMTNGNGCAFRLQGTLHMTMNANGDITANIEKITTNCN